jgi:hypothetical protein
MMASMSAKSLGESAFRRTVQKYISVWLSQDACTRVCDLDELLTRLNQRRREHNPAPHRFERAPDELTSGTTSYKLPVRWVSVPGDRDFWQFCARQSGLGSMMARTRLH